MTTLLIPPIEWTQFKSVGMEATGIESLEDRAKAHLSTLYVESSRESTALLAAANDPTVAANPARALQLQMEMEHFSLNATLQSLLAKHATDTVETLLKS